MSPFTEGPQCACTLQHAIILLFKIYFMRKINIKATAERGV